MKDVDVTATEEPRQKLEFDTDKGSRRSTVIAALLVVALVGWMGSGFVMPSETEEKAPAATQVEPVTVAVRGSAAETVTQYFLAEGQALPERDTVVLAEVSGTIAEVFVEKGDHLKAGQEIARFALAQREAELALAREEVARTKRDFENAETLLERGTATSDRVSQTRSAYASARAQLASVEESIAATVIKSPFEGRLESLIIDPGEYVQSGAEVGRIVDNTPLTVTIQVPQQSLKRIKVGQMAQVEFITGQVRTGKVAFVGTNAAADTRTFLAEIRVENADGEIPAGISAQVRIPTGEEKAHFLSPAILSLNTEGVLGVKTVMEDNSVAFSPVTIVRAQTDGIWVNGLPDEVDVITVGQGYVNSGQVVSPQREEPVN